MKRLFLVLALIGSLLFAASASASAGDANRDRIPDRWEKRHGLSLKVKQTRRDQDRDGFHNRAEWRASTDPRDPDSDDDGTEDAEENAGTVTTFANGELTITLFDGGTLTATVTDDTEIECGDVATAAHDDPGGRWDDDEDEGDREDDGDEGDHGDDDCDDGRHAHGDEDECAQDAIAPGAAVEEAALKISSTGRTWTEIDLR